MSFDRQLAEFAVAAVPPAAALDIMRLSLFDWAACGVAGCDQPVARAVGRMVRAEGGAGQAALIGGGRAPARGAALVNGAASHALDFDDTHFGHIGHPSVAVLPAALATAEHVGAAGPEMLAAALVGAELSVRLGLWLGRGHYRGGFHQTATAGAFGATAAAARLRRADVTQMRMALGLAATRAAGLKSQFGTMGKPYNAGIAAATGVECALLAMDGFVSEPDGLSVAQGFGPTHMGAADSAAALQGLGRDWLMERVSHKFHACCHGTHAALEALGALGGAGLGEVTAVRIITHPAWMNVCNIRVPATGLEAKFSYRFTAAMALSGHDTGRAAGFTDALTGDPALVALRDRVDVVADDAVAETAARVRVTLADGRTLAAEHDLARPVPAGQLQTRLRQKAGTLVASARADQLWRAVQGPAIAPLVAALA